MTQGSKQHARKVETLIYIVLWLIVAVVFVSDVMRARSYTSAPLLDGETCLWIANTLVPFLVLFALNNYVSIPRLLLRNRYGAYIVATIVLTAFVWGYQYAGFMQATAGLPRPPQHGPRHLLPLPVFLDLVYDALIIGVNLAVALIFRRYEDRLEKESLMKTHAEHRLAYLKAQINPHFYMNMLNNIHGMIDIDPAKAQDMLLDMSALMRYMLYDSTRPRIALSAEIRFLNNYLRLMRQRYPDSRVSITSDLPAEEDVAGIQVPPLLFLVFIENAFKHGISYRDRSFVSVGLRADETDITFTCLNSSHPVSGEVESPRPDSGGIGLDNVRQRLDLIYGSRYTLDIHPTATTYSVNLIIPTHETPDTDC